MTWPRKPVEDVGMWEICERKKETVLTATRSSALFFAAVTDRRWKDGENMGEKNKITVGNTSPIVKSPFTPFWVGISLGGNMHCLGYYR